MKRILQSLVLSCGALSATVALAAPYPDKPIRMIVPAAAGGAADTLARMIGRGLTEKFGQPVVIENKPGAAAIVGMTAIAKAPADGYTLGMTFSGAMSINPSLYQQLPYDPVEDFAPITIVAVSPLVIAVSPELGPKSLGEFLALAKKDPGKLTFGSAGTGSTQHLSMELLKSTAGVDMQHAAFAWPTGVLHAREKVRLLAPVYPGEELEASVLVKDKYLKNDKRFVVLEITVRKLENARIALVAERSLVWPN